jgi:hypothetical protein
MQSAFGFVTNVGVIAIAESPAQFSHAFASLDVKLRRPRGGVADTTAASDPKYLTFDPWHTLVLSVGPGHP